MNRTGNRLRRKEGGDGPIPLLLKDPEIITKMLDPATHFLKSVVELKWALVERAVICLLEGMQARHKVQTPEKVDTLNKSLRILKQRGKRWGGESFMKQISVLHWAIGQARNGRNALAHGKLRCASLGKLEVGPGKPNISHIEPFIQGPLTMMLEEKGTVVTLEAGKLREMNDQVNKVLSCIYEIYQDQGFEKVHIVGEIRIENADDPNISFAPDRVAREKSWEATIDLQELWVSEGIKHYACPECGQVGTVEFAARCHGRVPKEVETEPCYICNRVYDKKNLCEHLAIVKQYLYGTTERKWKVGTWIPSAEEAREMSKMLLEAADRMDAGEGVGITVDFHGKIRTVEKGG